MRNHEGMCKDLKHAAAIAAYLLLAALCTTSARADYKVSCVQGGEVVFSKTFEGDVTQAEKVRLSNRYSNAMCLFLSADTPAATGGDAAKALIDAWGGDVLDEDLRSALSIISAGGEGAPRPMNETPVVLGEIGVGVVIGVYDGVDMMTVVEHWKAATATSQYLALFDPEFRTAGEVITVALRDVPDVIISNVCEDAEKAGYKCTAFF